MKIAEWRKSLAAALTGTAAWGVTAQVDGITAVEWWGLAVVLAGAAVVWLVPNDPSTVSTADRLEELGLHDDLPTTGAPDGGQGIVGGLLAVLLLLLILKLIGVF